MATLGGNMTNLPRHLRNVMVGKVERIKPDSDSYKKAIAPVAALEEKQSDETRSRIVSAILREERRQERQREKVERRQPKCQGVNLTVGCRVGDKDAKKLMHDVRVPRLGSPTFGRLAKQDPAGISQDPAGWNGWRREWERERTPVNGGYPPRSTPIMKNGAEKTRVVNTRKRVKGMQIPGMASGHDM